MVYGQKIQFGVVLALHSSLIITFGNSNLEACDADDFDKYCIDSYQSFYKASKF